MNIPNGFKLVPVEPTEEMIEWVEGDPYTFSTGDEEWVGLVGEDMAREIYVAMISAAPTPPQQIYDEAKERELFEAHYRKEFEENSGNELSDADIQSMRDGPWYGESRHYLNGQWAGWKQCAKHRAKAWEVGHE